MQSCARETGWCLHELISGKQIINVIRHICCVQDLSHIASLESLLCMSDALGEVLTSVCGREVEGVCTCARVCMPDASHTLCPPPAHTSSERYIKGIALEYGHIIAMVALRRARIGFGGEDQSE